MKRRFTFFMALCLILCLISGCSVQKGNKKQEANKGPDGNKNTKSTMSSASIPSGAYWATYTVPNKSNNPKLANQDGPLYVRGIEIGEISTEEIIAAVEFSEGVNFASDTNPSDHSKYWVERIQNADGGTASIKLSSNAANNFYLNLQLYTLPTENYSHGIHVCDSNGLGSNGGVHSPGGDILSDPYKDPELPIAGFKELRFKGSFRQGTKIKSEVQQAGYETFSARYQNGEYLFRTQKELMGRAKIEETLLKPKRWFPDDAKTKGNVGTYNYSDGFTGKITFDWTFASVPFTVKINDAKLKWRDDGEDQTTYSLSGTAEISMKSFTIEGVVYKLKDKQRKAFSEEDCFIVRKIPEPAVYWYYSDSWEYTNQYGTSMFIGVNYAISKGPSDISYVKVKDLDEIDGKYNMSYMLPGMGGTATWTFKPDSR